MPLQLPDGTEIQVGPDRFAVPEVLFNPVRLPNARTLMLTESHIVIDLGDVLATSFDCCMP